MPSTAERIWETTRTLPEPLQAEVLDFAEFLRTRQEKRLDSVDELPLASLCGGLVNSPTFAGSPVDIQERLRNEWR